LYGIADIIFLVMFYLIGYRKVVDANLQHSFPNKTEAELKASGAASSAILSITGLRQLSCFPSVKSAE
jgi:lauroyl/myristoyl acyltransferase